MPRRATSHSRRSSRAGPGPAEWTRRAGVEEGIPRDQLPQVSVGGDVEVAEPGVPGIGPYERIRGRRCIASAAIIALIAFRGV